MRLISVDKVPAVGPYSQAVEEGNLIFCSGQIGINPQTNEVKGDFISQIKQAFENVRTILETAGSAPEKVIKITVYLKSMENFLVMNEIFAEFFGTHKPARVTVGVADLPKGALVEFDVIAEKTAANP